MFFFYKKNFNNYDNSVPDGLYSSNALLISLIYGLKIDAFFNQINSLEILTDLSFKTDLALLLSFIMY
jgi:hypothetical protein